MLYINNPAIYKKILLYLKLILEINKWVLRFFLINKKKMNF